MSQSSANALGRGPGLVVTAVGPDRPGLVNSLATFVKRAGGNIEDTRMAKLGGEFAVIIFVTGTTQNIDSLLADRSAIESELGLTCFMKATRSEVNADAGLLYVLEVSALDRPGIVESVSEILAKWAVNVASLTSRVVHAPLSGTPMFVLEAEVQIPTSVKLHELRRELAEAADRENLDLSLNAGHR